MSDIRSKKNKEVTQGESSFQNMKTSCSIPLETRTQSKNGELILHCQEE